MSSFYGSSYKYPFVLNAYNQVEKAIEADAVAQSIVMLFSTPLGTMFFTRTVGTVLRSALWKPNNEAGITSALITSCTLVEQIETRAAKVTGRVVERTIDSVLVKIEYTLKTTGVQEFLVIPFKNTSNV